MSKRKLQRIDYKTGFSYQVILPKALVEGLGWKPNDILDFKLQNGGLLIIKKES